MDGIAAWLAVAAAGALHGLHPASGWPLAAACARRAGPRDGAVLALPAAVALGHGALMVLLAATTVLDLPAWLQPPAWASLSGPLPWPQLLPGCLGDRAAAASATHPLALAASIAAVHSAAMALTSLLLAQGSRVVLAVSRAPPRWCRSTSRRWPRR